MKRFLILTIFALTLFVGCATQKLFYWGDYSETLYAFKQNPDEKTAEAHKKMLLKIIDESPKKNKVVPPGVNAEYGYMLIKEGKEEEGLHYINQEETLYPESAVFFERLKNEIKRGKK